MRRHTGKMLLVVLLGLAGCATAPRTVHQLLDQSGFDGAHMMAALISMDGGDTRIITDVPAVFAALKHTTLVSAMAVTPACVLYFSNGSSIPTQTISVHIANSGKGYVEYLGSKSYFTGPALRGFCAAEFARSEPLGSALRVPGR